MSSDPIEVLRRMRDGWAAGQINEDEKAAIDTAIASLSAPKPESAEAVHATAKYGWERSAWVWEDVEKGLEQFTAPPRPEASDENVLCRECGQPTMHMGNICYACSHPAPQQASAPVGVEEVVKAMRLLAGVGIPVKPECVGRWADQLEALAQQPAAVDGAMVERALVAFWGRHWNEDVEIGADRAEDMRNALTAALAGQQQGGTPE